MVLMNQYFYMFDILTEVQYVYNSKEFCMCTVLSTENVHDSSVLR